MTLTFSRPPAAMGAPINGSVANASDVATHAVIPAQGPGKKIYITQITVGNISATATVVELSGLDSGNSYYIPAPANTGGAVLAFSPPLPFGANLAMTMQNLTNLAGVYLSANGFVI